jgi:hypothetical protein
MWAGPDDTEAGVSSICLALRVSSSIDMRWLRDHLGFVNDAPEIGRQQHLRVVADAVAPDVLNILRFAG